ncbi:MAG: lipoyl synthase [Chloroflexi bacterium]|nr:lipoyl synthase [Chloroflexota bacterium]
MLVTTTPERRLPEWLKVRMPGSPGFLDVRQKLRTAELHTVCEEAHCPNIGECWERKSATFMILGEVCTRACRYCAVTSGKPSALDLDEPLRVARTVEQLGLRYVVITSVDRDDLADGGAWSFAESIRQIHKRLPACGVEVLIPDFQGDWDALRAVLEAGPAVLNHNIETVRSVFKSVRAKGDFNLSLRLLEKSHEMFPDIPTKSGIMVGLGETRAEISETMADLRAHGVDLITVGQYLRPTKGHVKMDRFYPPREFKEIEEEGYALGFKHVASGPLVRSSYHADEQHDAATARNER